MFPKSYLKKGLKYLPEYCTRELEVRIWGVSQLLPVKRCYSPPPNTSLRVDLIIEKRKVYKEISHITQKRANILTFPAHRHRSCISHPPDVSLAPIT